VISTPVQRFDAGRARVLGALVAAAAARVSSALRL
jgi:DNA-binding IclR family transcriptional regulator